jgi:hypothetical protein
LSVSVARLLGLRDREYSSESLRLKDILAGGVGFGLQWLSRWVDLGRRDVGRLDVNGAGECEH